MGAQWPSVAVVCLTSPAFMQQWQFSFLQSFQNNLILTRLICIPKLAVILLYSRYFIHYLRGLHVIRCIDRRRVVQLHWHPMLQFLCLCGGRCGRCHFWEALYRFRFWQTCISLNIQLSFLFPEDIEINKCK